MSAVETIDVNAVIPDGIEPVEALRCWVLEPGGSLRSLNNIEWTAGEPLKAVCHGQAEGYEWDVVRHGMTLREAQDVAKKMIEHRSEMATFYSLSLSGYARPYSYPPIPSTPQVEPPQGYGFQLNRIHHESPDANCTCGIYAATHQNTVPETGTVYGKVKLWGKIVPGEKGMRAEFAYPSEFRVSSALADDPALKAFGVPIIVDDDVPAITPDPGVLSLTSIRPDRSRRLLHLATAMNISACLLNLGLIGWRLW